MTYIATALVMGFLFLPASHPAPVNNPPAAQVASAEQDEPSPRKVATAKVVATNSYEVKLTGYNAVVGQTDSDPNTTASGIASNHEVIAARSQDLAKELPFGTVVLFSRVGQDTPGCNFHKVEDQIGYRVVADTMNARWENRMDVQLDTSDKVVVDGRSVNPAAALGVCGAVKVKVVGYIPLSRVPATQAELAQIFAPREVAINK
jgi:3D (Asp-Asp-Asp) domain-containing protein